MLGRVATCVVGVVVMIGLAQAAHAQSAQGTWQLKAVTGGTAADAVEPLGLMIIDDTHFAWVLYSADHPRQSLPALKTPGRPTDAEMIAFAQHLQGFSAQAGTVSVRGMTYTFMPSIRSIKGTNGYSYPLTFTAHFDGNDTVSFTGTANGRMFTWTRVK